MEISEASQAISSILNAVCGAGRTRPTDNDLPTSGETESKIVNHMEAFWIRILHDAFRQYYVEAKYPGLVVFSKAQRDAEWSRSEFLHDVTVLERATVLSAYKGHPLPVARRVLWQVESEISGNGRDVAIDFSKLIAGSAENKLLIVRQPMKWQSDGKKRVRRFVEDMAGPCSGNLFLAFVPAYASAHGHLAAYWKVDQALPYDLYVRAGSGGFEVLGPT